MNKMIMNRLTMLAVTLMASMACFAQGKSATGWGAVFGPNYQELEYNVVDGSPFQVSVKGFADYIIANPQWMITPPDQAGVTIVANTVTIPHYLEGGTNPNVWNHTVEANAFKTVSADLASAITKLSIEFVDNNDTDGKPVIIGENAFSGLTSLTTVISETPGANVTNIPVSAFDANVYKTAVLIVPDGSMGKYNQRTGWKNFYNIKTKSGLLLGDYDGTGEVDQADAIKLQRALKKSLTGSLDPYDEALDFNNDGSVDQGDYILFTRKLKSQE